MKRNILYVFPNISTFNRSGRGGLHERYETAEIHNCSFVEIPADFIKNKTELELTNLELGSIPTADAVKKLYKLGTPSKNVKYIMHTEPSLSRSDNAGTSITPQLLWNNRKWVNEFINMIVTISKRFKSAPTGIEIHPGGKHNTYDDLIRSIIAIRTKFENTFQVAPFIVIENRTGQFISDGNQISEFWEKLSSKNSELRNTVGIVLDIQQLYTVTKKNFQKQLKMIPHKSIKGLHIHCRHRTPSLENEIPWKSVFSWIKEIKHKIFINPEVHHQSQAIDTISFCEKMME